MIQRAAMIGIIAFWLVMMALLVRVETHPEGTDILEVPVSYVVRIMFKNGQQSLLTLHEQEKPIGTMAIKPTLTGSIGAMLDFSGAMSLQLSMGPGRQRFNFHGGVDMDRAFKMNGFHVDLSLQQLKCQVSVRGDLARKSLTYSVRQGGVETMSQALPMDSGQIGPALLKSLGFDEHAVPIPTTSVAAPVVTARETQMTLHGEQIAVYRITASEGATPVADIYVTQLGQIVLATTSFGYTLSAEDYQ
jgi:hypothetical protein